jgi:hypothetical protein
MTSRLAAGLEAAPVQAVGAVVKAMDLASEMESESESELELVPRRGLTGRQNQPGRRHRLETCWPVGHLPWSPPEKTQPRLLRARALE